MADYRPVPDERMADRRRISAYAFDASSGPYDPQEGVSDRLERYYGFDERRGLFDGAEMVATCGHVPFTVRVRGEWLPMGGLTGVATPPEHRHRGYVTDLVEASLREYRDREWPLAALLPFDESFYARYGWATGCRYHEATAETEALEPVAVECDGDGTFERVRPDEIDRLRPVYEDWLDGIGLATRRSDDWWRDRVFHIHESELFCYAWARDGAVRGYLLYEVDTGDGGTLRVDEMAYADHDALANLLRFCYHHDAQVDTVELVGRALDSLVDLVPDRDALEVTVNAGQMVRVVDVVSALEAISYPRVEAADVVLDVTDDHAPWNDRQFAVSVDDGDVTVEAGDETGTADASLPIDTLSQLLVGYRSVESARASADVDVASEAAADSLVRMFPGRPTYLPERF